MAQPAERRSGAATREPPRPSWKAIVPREHGAYAELTFPLLSGVVLGGGALASLAFAAAAVALFLAHEPAAVLLGRRGGRARETLGAPARRALAVLVGSAVVATGAFLVAAEPAARVAALVPAALAALAAFSLARGRERTTAGELLVSVALATTALPTALAGSTGWRFAALLAGVWAVVLVLGIAAARAVILEAKAAGRPVAEGRLARAGGALAAAVAVVGLAAGWLPGRFAAALLVASCGVLLLSLGRPHPRHLRRVGWTLVAIDVFTFAVLLAPPAAAG